MKRCQQRPVNGARSSVWPPAGGRMEEKRQKEKERMVKRQNGLIIQKLFWLRTAVKFFLNLFHNAVVFFQLSVIFEKLRRYDTICLKIQSHGLLGGKKCSQFVKLVQNIKHDLHFSTDNYRYNCSLLTPMYFLAKISQLTVLN